MRESGAPLTRVMKVRVRSVSQALVGLDRVGLVGLERANSNGAVIVVGCDSATETVRDGVPADLEVIEGMKLAFARSGLRWRELLALVSLPSCVADRHSTTSVSGRHWYREGPKGVAAVPEPGSKRARSTASKRRSRAAHCR